MKISTIILAAGQGTRMVSDLPKVLHPLNGKPLDPVCGGNCAMRLGLEKPVVVIGNGAEQVRETVGDQGSLCFAGETPGNSPCGAGCRER